MKTLWVSGVFEIVLVMGVGFSDDLGEFLRWFAAELGFFRGRGGVVMIFDDVFGEG